jgi:hypothetical protein
MIMFNQDCCDNICELCGCLRWHSFMVIVLKLQFWWPFVKEKLIVQSLYSYCDHKLAAMQCKYNCKLQVLVSSNSRN